MSESFSDRPSHAAKSCCEEAAMNAAKVDRLTRERDELQEGIAAQRRLRAELDTLTFERDEARDVAARNNAKVAVLARERDELQAKLDDLTMTVKELAPAKQTTLDRGAVMAVLRSHLHADLRDPIADQIMALAPAAPSWPEWLGSRPVLRVPVRNVDDNWTFHDGNECIDGDVSEQSCREAIEDRLADAVKWAGILSAIEAEQAATGDEDQRVEEHAKALAAALINNRGTRTWDDLSGASRDVYRAAIRAGWTPPESEASE